MLRTQATAPPIHRLLINPLELCAGQELLFQAVRMLGLQLPKRPRLYLTDNLQNSDCTQTNLSADAPQRTAFDLVKNINAYVAFTWGLIRCR